MTLSEECPDLARFISGEADLASFSHREHVRMGFELLQRYDFVETALWYSRALSAMTAKIGKPERFHQTMTIAFLSLIAERLEAFEGHLSPRTLSLGVCATHLPASNGRYQPYIVSTTRNSAWPLIILA
jgi:hypothetical protein